MDPAAHPLPVEVIERVIGHMNNARDTLKTSHTLVSRVWALLLRPRVLAHITLRSYNDGRRFIEHIRSTVLPHHVRIAPCVRSLTLNQDMAERNWLHNILFYTSGDLLSSLKAVTIIYHGILSSDIMAAPPKSLHDDLPRTLPPFPIDYFVCNCAGAFQTPTALGRFLSSLSRTSDITIRLWPNDYWSTPPHRLHPPEAMFRKPMLSLRGINLISRTTNEKISIMSFLLSLTTPLGGRSRPSHWPSLSYGEANEIARLAEDIFGECRCPSCEYFENIPGCKALLYHQQRTNIDIDIAWKDLIHPQYTKYSQIVISNEAHWLGLAFLDQRTLHRIDLRFCSRPSVAIGGRGQVLIRDFAYKLRELDEILSGISTAVSSHFKCTIQFRVKAGLGHSKKLRREKKQIIVYVREQMPQIHNKNGLEVEFAELEPEYY